MNGAARILHHQIAQNGRAACFGINLDIDHMRAKACPHAVCIGFVMARDWPAIAAHLGTNFGDAHGRELAGIGACGHGGTVFPNDRLFLNAPFFCGTAAHLGHSVAGGFDRCLAGGKGGAAAMAGFVHAQSAGFHDVHAHRFIFDSQRFGDHQGQRGATAADIGRAG